MDKLKHVAPPIGFLLLTVLIIGALVHDHYQRGYVFTSRSSNASVFIERALKRISKCIDGDQSRQRALLYALQAWTHLVHPQSIRYWISHRTLINYVQYDGLGFEQFDIDISMMADETSRLIELAKTVSSPSRYHLQVHPQWSTVNISTRSLFPSLGINFITYNPRFIDRVSNVSINIWPTYEDNSAEQTHSLAQFINADDWTLLPFEWTFPLTLCVLSGIRVWCPVQPDKLVASVYRSIASDASRINQTCIR